MNPNEATAETLPLAELIRRCVELNGNDDWRVFLRTVRDLVRGGFLHYSRFRHRVNEFEDWFGGWLLTESSLDTELETLRRHYQQPEHTHIPERDRHARNYLRCIIQSARAEFEAEGRSRLPVDVDVDPNEVVRRDPRQQLAERAAEVRAAASQLNQNIRIPFWLRYLLICGQLLPEDLRFLQNVRTDAEDLINEREVAAREHGHLSPLDGVTIGQLMGITQDCVAQRVRTGLLCVRGFLGLPPQTPVSG